MGTAGARAEGRSIDLATRFMGADRVDRAARLEARMGEDLLIGVDDGLGRGADGRIVVYMDLIGRVEGRARWTADDALRFTMETVPAKRDRVLRQVDKVEGMSVELRSDSRGSTRIVPRFPDAVVTTGDGRRWGASVENVSRSGAYLRTDAPAAVGDILEVGATRAKVSRLTDDGVAVAFTRLVPLDQFDDGFRP